MKHLILALTLLIPIASHADEAITTETFVGSWESGAYCKDQEVKRFPRGYTLSQFADPKKYSIFNIFLDVEEGKATIENENDSEGTFTVVSSCSSGFNDDHNGWRKSQTAKYRVTVKAKVKAKAK